MRWFERQRQAWIKERLGTQGRINRADITSQFDVSVQTASHDLAEFQKLHPGVVQYDKSSKQYILTGDA